MSNLSIRSVAKNTIAGGAIFAMLGEYNQVGTEALQIKRGSAKRGIQAVVPGTPREVKQKAFTPQNEAYGGNAMSPILTPSNELKEFLKELNLNSHLRVTADKYQGKMLKLHGLAHVDPRFYMLDLQAYKLPKDIRKKQHDIQVLRELRDYYRNLDTVRRNLNPAFNASELEELNLPLPSEDLILTRSYSPVVGVFEALLDYATKGLRAVSIGSGISASGPAGQM